VMVVAVVVVRAGLSSQPRIVLRMRRAPNRESAWHTRWRDPTAPATTTRTAPDTPGRFAALRKSSQVAVCRVERRTGPQSGGPSTNFPRGIEIGVEWTTNLVNYMSEHGYIREEASREAEQEWNAYVGGLYKFMLMRKTQSWFTGYNSNVEGHEKGSIRHLVYFGGRPKYRAKIEAAANADYSGISFQ
jgi:hypothetical protein